jgi:hypothetical protein
MTAVPENQIVAKLVDTKFNSDFAAIALQLQPTIHQWTRRPQQVVRFEADAKWFFGFRPVPAHIIESTAFYCHRLHILPDYRNRPHFAQLTKTALLAYLRLGQVATENALVLLNSPNH